MSLKGSRNKREDIEWISNKDLVACAHELMGGIDLDPASSKIANEYVEAENFFTPTDDGLNVQQWFGKVYLFPPAGAYFWDQKQGRWKMTRTSAISLTSSPAVWFRRLYHAWLTREIKEGLFFTNCPDMIRYDQRIFDFPVCILRTTPMLMRRTLEGVAPYKTCTSLLVYLQPIENATEATERFAEIYSPRGRILG
jgi:hypothetical protein